MSKGSFMDDIKGTLFVRMITFGPAVVLLTFALVIGVLMLLEKLGAARARRKEALAAKLRAARGSHLSNPRPGQIVSDLRQLIEVEGMLDEAKGARSDSD